MTVRWSVEECKEATRTLSPTLSPAPSPCPYMGIDTAVSLLSVGVKCNGQTVTRSKRQSEKTYLTIPSVAYHQHSLHAMTNEQSDGDQEAVFAIFAMYSLFGSVWKLTTIQFVLA